MLKDLIKLADHLDRKGLAKEANYLDSLISKSAEYTYSDNLEDSYDDILPSGIDLVNSLVMIHTKLQQAFRATLQQSPEEKEFLIETWQSLEPEIRKIKEVALKKI